MKPDWAFSRPLEALETFFRVSDKETAAKNLQIRGARVHSSGPVRATHSCAAPSCDIRGTKVMHVERYSLSASPFLEAPILFDRAELPGKRTEAGRCTKAAQQVQTSAFRFPGSSTGYYEDFSTAHSPPLRGATGGEAATGHRQNCVERVLD